MFCFVRSSTHPSKNPSSRHNLFPSALASTSQLRYFIIVRASLEKNNESQPQSFPSPKISIEERRKQKGQMFLRHPSSSFFCQSVKWVEDKDSNLPPGVMRPKFFFSLARSRKSSPTTLKCEMSVMNAAKAQPSPLRPEIERRRKV
jgi:hypothetical protein